MKNCEECGNEIEDDEDICEECMNNLASSLLLTDNFGIDEEDLC